MHYHRHACRTYTKCSKPRVVVNVSVRYCCYTSCPQRQEVNLHSLLFVEPCSQCSRQPHSLVLYDRAVRAALECSSVRILEHSGSASCQLVQFELQLRRIKFAFSLFPRKLFLRFFWRWQQHVSRLAGQVRFFVFSKLDTLTAHRPRAAGGRSQDGD